MKRPQRKFLRARAGSVLASAIFIFLGAQSFAQETTESPPPSTTPTPTPTVSAAPARNLRVRFLPPPLDGAITLGIFNQAGQLVRLLRQEAELDEFEVGADALVTHWDGKDDEGNELPAGTYHARGFVAAPMKIEAADAPNESLPEATSLRVKLIANPLENDRRPSLDLSVGFDDENAFLKTNDGLPLITVATTSAETKRVWMTTGRENKSVTVFLESESGTRQFRISGLEKIMSFDAGEIALK